MKAEFDKEFWNKLNPISKLLIKISVLLTDIAFRLSNMSPDKL